MALAAVASVALERTLFHLLVVPAVGIAGSWMIGWSWLVFFTLDALLSIGYEVIRVGVLGVSIGIKDVIPVLIYFHVGLPRPTLVAAVASALVLAGLAAGGVGYLLRRRTRPAVHTGRYWRRPVLAMAAGMAAVMVGLFAAGVSLMYPTVGLLLALPAIPLGWLAYALQTPPPSGGGSQAGTVLTAWDKTSLPALAGGAR